MTLFLSVAEDYANDDDDDDLSLSSTDEHDNNVETDEGAKEVTQQSNDQVRADTGEQAEEPRGSQRQSQDTITFDDDDENDAQPQASAVFAAESDDDSVQVVDLTMSPVRSPPERQVTDSSSATTVARRPQQPSLSSQNQNNNDMEDEGDQASRFKKIAKKYKRKFQQQQSQCQEHYKKRQELTATMSDIQNTTAEKEDTIQQLQERTNSQHLELSHLRLENVKHSNELKSKNRQVAKLTSDIQRVNSDFRQFKAGYERSLSQAHSSSTAEVKELAMRTKELEQENAQLRAAVVNPKRSGRGVDAALAVGNSNKKKTKKQDMNVARALRRMDDVRTIPGSAKRKSDEYCATRKYTAQAARINLAVQKKRKGPLGVAAAEMLARPVGSLRQEFSSARQQESSTTTALNLKRRPLQRINSNDYPQTNKKKKSPPKTASNFFQQRR